MRLPLYKTRRAVAYTIIGFGTVVEEAGSWITVALPPRVIPEDAWKLPK